MPDLIERYVYDVVRRLPEKDREEVRRELNASICDMLDEPASEENIREVLASLGPPQELAEQYRPQPRYLISPAMYDSYVRALKRVLPLVGCLLLLGGLIMGSINTIKDGLAPIQSVIQNTISTGLSMAVSGTLQTLVWVTLGFAIADRVCAKKPGTAAWSVDDLPEEIPKDKGRIPLSDSIAELIVLLVFSTIGLLLLFGRLPGVFLPHSSIQYVYQLFSDQFLAVCIPIFLFSVFLEIVVSVIKIVYRRWCPPVCAAVVVNDVVSIALIFFLCTRPQIFNPDFLAVASQQTWASHDILNYVGLPFGGNLPLVIIAIIVVVSGLAESVYAIIRTLHTMYSEN